MRDASKTAIWTFAIITALIGAAVLFDAEPGVNWPIWIAAASLSVAAARLISIGKVERPLAILLAWATLLSVSWAVTTNEFFHFLVILSDAMLLGLAIVSIGAESWQALSAKLLAVVPFLAPFRVWRAAANQVADAPRSVSSHRSRALIKGAVLSVPLVIVLIALLGNADPVIRWGTDRLSALLPDWSFPPRLLFFLFLLSITLGANAIAARQLAPALPNIPSPGRSLVIGLTEQRMILWSAAVVLWLFVILQVSYLIHPPPSAMNSGVTFADYARRGFGELSVAATIVGAIILVLEYARPTETTDTDRKSLRRLELALLVALELILLSAFRRVVLYEQAYGFTSARLTAQAYMTGMAIALVALGVEIERGRISVNFARRVAETALAVLTVMVFWNHEAWIVNRNIDRATVTGKFDVDYARRLSNDAIPTLIARRHELDPAYAAVVEGSVQCAPGEINRRWFEWNANAVRQRAALESVHPSACPAGQALHWSRRRAQTTTPNQPSAASADRSAS
jgi:hypothetical protein